VVVHGILASRTLPAIVATAEALAREHDVLTIDVRGHGADSGRFTWGREEWRGVAAAARHLAEGGRRVSAVGFSFGGYHAVRAALAGAPIERLVLVGAPVDLAVADHFPFGAGFWHHVPWFVRRRRCRPRFEWPRRLRERAIAKAELALVRAPALVVHGTADWLVTRRHAEAFSASIPGSRLVEFPGGLHAEYLVESHPEAFFDGISRWLR